MPFWKCFPCMRFQNEEVILKLQYSNCALSDVPPDVSQYERTLEELYLSSNRIRALSPQLFYCQGLRVLFVNDNDLESVPSAIGSLRHLENLNLGRNSLASIPENIKLCKNLMRLDLSLNNLQRLPDAITSLISLQELLLNETNLEFLPANFGRLVNLRILELRSNNLITLPKSMSRLSNLRRIDIGANEFTELPEVICQLGQLRELWIDVNRIRRISPNVSNLRELKHFEANNNLLSSLPNEISNWRNLEVLSVSTNDMKTLPFSIGMLKNLVTLQCEANQLRELPDSICHLENLEEFNISHNFLLRLPSTIGMLKKLCFFCADENILRCLPPEICSCSNLAVLSIRSNKIDELPPNIGYLENLHVLNLVDNNITQLPVSVLSLSKLTALWISDNQSQPLVPLQYLNSSSLTCFMLPQQSVAAHENNEKAEYNSDNDSGNSWPNGELEEEAILNGRAGGVYFADQQVENSKFALNNSPLPTQTARICFAQAELNEDNAGGGEHVTSPSRRICFADEVKGSELLATRLMRSPTPYPKELRLMAKYVRNNHQQQQQKQTIDDMVRAQAIGPASSALPGDQVDGSLYISVNSQASGATVEGVKEARVLFNPSGNAVFPQQIQNSINYPSGYVSQAGTVLTPLLQQQQKQQQQQQQQQQHHQQQQQQLYYQNYRNPINQTTKMIQQQQPHYQQQQPHHQEQQSHHQEQQSHHQQQKQQQQPDYLSSMYELQLYESSLKHQSTNKPPPYHIALNFTKKSREDLLNFDTLRTHLTHKNGNEHEGNEIRIQCEDDDHEDCNTEYSGHGDHQSSNPLNGRHCLENEFDNQNNNSSAEFQSGNMPLESGSVNNGIEIRVPPRSSSTTTWLFGLHKNPTVKQVAIKKDNGIGFEIQERPNQGIYVRGTHPNTSAASLLYANDKLLEVDGYDFSKICLLDAQQILENSGPVINVMISRT